MVKSEGSFENIARTKSLNRLLELCTQYFEALQIDPNNEETEQLLRTACYFFGRLKFEYSNMAKRHIYENLADNILLGTPGKSEGVITKLVNAARNHGSSAVERPKSYISMVFDNAVRSLRTAISAEFRSKTVSIDAPLEDTGITAKDIEHTIHPEHPDEIEKQQENAELLERVLARVNNGFPSMGKKKNAAAQKLVKGITEEMSTKEMAAFLGIPEGTVGSRLFNLRKRLKEEFPQKTEGHFSDKDTDSKRSR